MSQPALDITASPGDVEPTVVPEPTPAKKGKQSTEYVILVREGDKDFRPAKTVAAASGTAAIRAYLAELTEKDGTYVAVPARSWQPVTVKTETTTKLTLT